MSPITVAKWGGAAGVVLALLLLGRGCGVRSAEAAHKAELATKNTALTQAGDALDRSHRALTSAAYALKVVTDEADAAVERASEKQRQAEFAKERALMAAADYRKRLGVISSEIDRAKADPDCKRLLEATSCAAIQ
ncbi:hypothetical protein [Lysobacter sp. ESA13C]|uniref:hypothetical protein n=1 Tax=Lysobacter sp. ESA13C TaxID=2862676 RepID=UPI001CBB9D56|nr:hypothetical protein [Lysobacter sp. ESA13C]